MSSEKKPKASALYSMKAVMWAMLGVRKQSGYDEDVHKITAKQAIIFGLVGVFLFIMTLVGVVSLVI